MPKTIFISVPLSEADSQLFIQIKRNMEDWAGGLLSNADTIRYIIREKAESEAK